MTDQRPLAHKGLAEKPPLVASAVFALMGNFSMGLTLPHISSAYAGSQDAWLIPWIGSVTASAFAVFSALMGYLMGRLDSKRIYLVSIVCFVIFGCAPLFQTDLKTIVATRALLGVSVAGIVISASYRIGLLPETERATLFGLQELVGSITGLLIFPLVGVLIKFGWRAPFALHALGLLFLPLILTLPPDTFTPTQSPGLNEAPTRKVLGGLNVTLCLFAAVVGSELFLNINVSPYYLFSIGIRSPTAASIPITATVVATMIGSSCYGLLLRRTGTATVFILGSLLVSTGLVLCGTSKTLTFFTAGAFLSSFGLSNCVANSCNAAVQSNRDAPGRALCWIIGIMYLAPLGLPVTVAFIERSFGPGGSFIAFGLTSACAAGFFALKPSPTMRNASERPNDAPDSLLAAGEFQINDTTASS